jgi:ribosomal protein S12 methylthiotransferase accessory factor
MSAVPLEVALQRSRQRLQGNLGIVRHVRRILNGPGMPRIHSASSIINSIATYNHSEMVGHTGAVGFTWEQAAIGAVGECLERYCCAVYNHADLRYASARELGPGAVGMDRFELYTERQQAHPQFPFPRWHADLPIHWVPGRSLLDGGDRWVPASLTYIPYVPSNQPGRQADLLALAVSSGQACHTDPDAALLSGLCEVIERDAFMLVWSKKLSVPRLDVSGDAELSALFDRYFACPGLAFHLFDLTLDVPVPTVLCIAEGQSARGPYLCVGAACRPNYRDAVVKAWMEAAQGLIWAHSLIDSKPDWRPEPDFLNVRDF